MVKRKSKFKVNAYKAWTPSAENKLIKLYSQGMSIAEISKVMRRPNSGVYQRIALLLRNKRLKKFNKTISENNVLINSRWSYKDEKKLIKMCNEGYSNKYIAKILGRTLKSIKSKISDLRDKNNPDIGYRRTPSSEIKRGPGRPKKIETVTHNGETVTHNGKKITHECDNDEFVELLEDMIKLRNSNEFSKATINQICYGYVCAMKEGLEKEIR
jgi:gas vesicle protein